MSQASPDTDDDAQDEHDEELVLEGQTVVNGPDLIPNVGQKNSDDGDDED